MPQLKRGKRKEEASIRLGDEIHVHDGPQGDRKKIPRGTGRLGAVIQGNIWWEQLAGYEGGNILLWGRGEKGKLKVKSEGRMAMIWGPTVFGRGENSTGKGRDFQVIRNIEYGGKADGLIWGEVLRP